MARYMPLSRLPTAGNARGVEFLLCSDKFHASLS